MVVAWAAQPPVVIQPMHAESRRGSQLGNPEEDNKAYLNSGDDAPIGVLNVTDVLVVHYKPTKHGNYK